MKVTKHKNGEFSIKGGETEMEIILEALLLARDLLRHNSNTLFEDIEDYTNELEKKGLKDQNYMEL